MSAVTSAVQDKLRNDRPRRAQPLAWLAALLMTTVLAACGGSDAPPASNSNVDANEVPVITSTQAADGATGVAPNARIAAVFNIEMAPATINGSSFTLKHGNTQVAGKVAYSGKNAVFTPDAALALDTSYTATLTSAAASTAGNVLSGNQAVFPAPGNHIWRFTTGGTTDTTAPTVTATDPAQAQGNVALNKSVNATFSEAIDPLTITDASFTLKQGNTAVAGTLSYQGRTATFEPSALLTAGAVYTATIAKQVSDLAGNGLTDAVSWNFTAAADAPLPASGPAAVNLRSSSTFAILAGAGVTNTGSTTVITGDLGTAPTGSITGIDVNMVSGKIEAATPAATLAKQDLSSAYDDAQGRSLNAISLPGDLGGLTLAPGLYVNASSTGISGSGQLTLDAQGNSNAVWIFKMGSTLTTGTGSQIILAGGAKASNIYWSVGTSATLGVTSRFKGTIMADQSISAATGASIEGRLLTRIAAVTLQGNDVTVP
jgi:hypothetical protein